MHQNEYLWNTGLTLSPNEKLDSFEFKTSADDNLSANHCLSSLVRQETLLEKCCNSAKKSMLRSLKSTNNFFQYGKIVEKGRKLMRHKYHV